MNTQWLLVRQYGSSRDFAVYEFVSAGKERITYKLGQRRLWSTRGSALGLFPSYERADDAKQTAAYALQRQREVRGYGDSSVLDAIKECEGYQPTPEK
jgi:hypothetical protein